MMLGEQHRPNPTVHVPPWAIHLDDFNTLDSTLSPSSTSSSINAAEYSPYHLQEVLTALQRYLPSNDQEFDSDTEVSAGALDQQPDSPVDAYSCDHFRMYEFKVRKCARGRSHDWTECPYAHPGEKARRRDPRKYHYSGTACPDFRKGACKKGDSCEFAHGVFECWLHPARYRTQPCKDGQNCKRRVCFFAHSPDQLRVFPPQQGSKGLPFLSSPSGSISPPTSPGEASPPMSPMAKSLSRSLGSSSVSEMVASLRNLQLGKVKSLPSSWNVQVGGSPVFGSPRGGSMLRPGFCSLPTTPTRTPTRPGMGFWDTVCEEVEGEEEEEPAMERVESGRDLRARMFQKLSKDNPLDRVCRGQDPVAGPSATAPDVDWVSDLLE